MHEAGTDGKDKQHRADYAAENVASRLALNVPAGGWRPGAPLALRVPMALRAERGETFSNGWTDDMSAQCRNQNGTALATAGESDAHRHYHPILDILRMSSPTNAHS